MNKVEEKLEIYDMNSNLIGINSRDDFYNLINKEFDESNEISSKVKTVKILLMNSEGRIYLQKRSRIKTENANLYDKTIGGHVIAGDTYEWTVIKEFAEELGLSSTIAPKDNFHKAINTINLEIMAVFREVEYVDKFMSKRLLNDGRYIMQPQMTTFYIGYYDGYIKFIDGESCGIETITLEELQGELKNNFNKYTEDLKFMIDRYQRFLVPRKIVTK